MLHNFKKYLCKRSFYYFHFSVRLQRNLFVYKAVYSLPLNEFTFPFKCVENGEKPELLDQGKTKQEIAEFFNIDRTTIYRTLKRNGY
ncbi:helix-turn-helix domain-containing protein [Bacillus mycoides]|uniref:helix-turn-helix domain-containing protein n=1 Tax=Bacillus mycoides TaxID=1405 RepID=UPI002AA2A2AB|nr:helix-turn-helix domain-containing protein [Bacillus mycoides]